jgi:hypothetical protein
MDWPAKYAPEVVQVAHREEGRAFLADVLKNTGT